MYSMGYRVLRLAQVAAEAGGGSGQFEVSFVLLSNTLKLKPMIAERSGRAKSAGVITTSADQPLGKSGMTHPPVQAVGPTPTVLSLTDKLTPGAHPTLPIF